MGQYINKDTYIGNTGKQLKDIKTNSDNISSNTTKITNLEKNVKTNSNNISSNTTKITNLEKIKITAHFVSGDTQKTTTIARARFTENYELAYLVCIPISTGGTSSEDTGLVIFRARSNDTNTNIQYYADKTNSAQCEITQNGNILNFNIKQTAKWRYLSCVIIAKSENVEILIN